MATRMNLKYLWEKYANLTVLALLLGIYLATSVFIAINLRTGIIPDEPAHFVFSKHFASTAGIPPDTFETYSWGWYIQQNPFLYYWINGRIINLIQWIAPQISDTDLLISLRLVSVLYGLATLITCYQLSRIVIKGRWWQLLPVFLLSQTLMFVFLSGGVNYDNLANLLCTASLYYFVKSIKKKNFLRDSLLWFILIGLGTLVKFTILPLAFIMVLTWIFFLIKNHKDLQPIRFLSFDKIILTFIAILLAVGNFAIYGVNLIRFGALTPPCQEILLESQCDISPYVRRSEQIALNPKLSIRESINQGFPPPIRYALVDWVWHMLIRSYGIIGHRSYFPLQLITFYQIWFYLIMTMAFFGLAYYRKLSFASFSLIVISLFYAGVLFFQNYSSELVYGFQQIALQGRYIFPVIGALYVLVTKTIKFIPIKILRWTTLAFTIILLLIGGPITVLRGLNSFLLNWFNI